MIGIQNSVINKRKIINLLSSELVNVFSLIFFGREHVMKIDHDRPVVDFFGAGNSVSRIRVDFVPKVHKKHDRGTNDAKEVAIEPVVFVNFLFFQILNVIRIYSVHFGHIFFSQKRVFRIVNVAISEKNV